MNNNDIRDNIRNLNNEYGNGFGYKVYLITFISSMIFIAIAIAVMLFVKSKDSNEEFVLDNDKKYIISIFIPNSNTYYEVDFDKNKVIKRTDSERFKREKLADIKLQYDELEKLVLEIITDEENKFLSQEDQREINRERSYPVYKIKTSEHEEYYVKKPNQIEELNYLLDN